MKMLKVTVAVLAAFWCSSATYSQNSDSLGVIGDNLDLYAVLDAFKNAENLEEFEKTINNPDNKINNLDLDEDDQVDYIQVHDEGEDDAHAIILRVAMGEREDDIQDIAAIELEKSGDNNATVQIVGDEELYGADYIVEPKQEEAITKRLMMPNLIVINVWGWRSVRWIYGPTYKRWRSPYRWGVYPRWWKPWRPYRWSVYHGFHGHHHRHFHVVKVRRCGRAHGHYVKKRRVCVKIKNHHHHHNNHGHHGHNHGHHHGHKNGTHQGHGHKTSDGKGNGNQNHKDQPNGSQKKGNTVKSTGGQSKNNGGQVNKGNEQKKSGGQSKKNGGASKKSGGQQNRGGNVKKSGGQKKGGGATKRR